MSKKMETFKGNSFMKQPASEEKFPENTSKKFEKIENQFDKDTKPQSQGGRMDYVTAVHELEKIRLSIGERFIDEDIRQKTDITDDESIILSILEYMADHPYSISMDVMTNKNNPYHILRKPTRKYKIVPLQIFIENYRRYLISVGRKGRKEIVDVLKSLLGGGNNSYSLSSEVKKMEQPPLK